MQPQASITPAQAKTLKESVPVIAADGVAIANLMYGRLLGQHPELNGIFNVVHQHTGKQPKALAMALYAFANNIDDLGKLSPALELICQKHASLYLRPEYYDIVGEYLIDSMQTILDYDFTDEMREAWTAGYRLLSQTMIGREVKLYEGKDGWTDWRDFRIAKKVQESSEVTSFYLEPVESFSNGLPTFLPGQYISVRVNVPDLGKLQPRQYSLSDAPNGKYYRISVKREDGGYVSNVLHNLKHVGDVVQVAHPYGEFTFDPATEPVDAPVVFLGAGVGATALLSMLNSIAVASQTTRPVAWIHAARRTEVRPFGAHLAQLRLQLPLLRTVLFASRPGRKDALGTDYDFRGRMELARLERDGDLFLHDKRTRYFVCGPDDFMSDVSNGLKGLGVEGDRVRWEQYGDGGVERYLPGGWPTASNLQRW
ncbi:globin-like protein [Auriculariales sp. MPI-PUGE-AT-0066]|nr:globin-like protein [Auriculariales sp. MPI-PUGE-AT-0066]